ncbi:hypothetical protein BJ322DRAFT_1002310 [Thelephora terrestris]|uniref:UBC core domain-containing protein n=1 Tax=Thelephora terrestris TaxID=56493 RepID=A0A9P6HL37_9AGAM|nr:hypothetical protein BJ322DRAFT_1002310 [Thelephora terrestris]
MPQTSAKPLRGRRRFMADLEELKSTGFSLHNHRLNRLRSGDDEGSVEFVILRANHHLVTINLLASDTSDYPESHQFYAFALEANGIPDYVATVIQGITDRPSRTLQETIRRLFFDLARAESQGESSDEHEEETSDEDDIDGDFDYGYDAVLSQPTRFEVEQLRKDFLETIAHDYRPGLIRMGEDRFLISVSLPIVQLARRIPLRVLSAWDKRLLARTQHLTLLISGLGREYPILDSDGEYRREAKNAGVDLSFNVGLCQRYKPSKDQALELVRKHGLKNVEEHIQQPPELLGTDDEDEDDAQQERVSTPEPEEMDPGHLERFSLSTSLESVLQNLFLPVLRLRVKYNLGWAGAETLLADVETLQQSPEMLFAYREVEYRRADAAEMEMGRSYALPADPLFAGNTQVKVLNLPWLTFTYLLRRFMLCTRYCLVCHKTIDTNFDVIKPYVCNNHLCAYQYYLMGRGPSLEYEICHNLPTVDLLVSLAYSAAVGGVLEDPLPVNLGLRVKPPRTGSSSPGLGVDGLCDFDALDINGKRAAIADLIDSLPAITEMKRHLQKPVTTWGVKPQLQTMDPLTILPAAWIVLRWCVGSCTAHLEELVDPSDLMQGVDLNYRQFRFSVGAPEAETKFKQAVQSAQQTSRNAMEYPSLYAFHGSALKNWHSIIRHGLWFKTVAHGRAFGHGVYFAKEGTTSLGSYAHGGSTWRNSQLYPQSCAALAEIVNLPENFVSNHPHYVVADTTWIVCRYLLVSNRNNPSPHAPKSPTVATRGAPSETIPMVRMDPQRRVTLGGQEISIPLPEYKLEKLRRERENEYMEEDQDEDDLALFADPASTSSQPKQSDVYEEPPRSTARPADDWKHDPDWVKETVTQMMLAPTDSTSMATMALQRELNAMLKEQERAKSLGELGWYIPPEFIEDNLYQWIVELHSFDKDLPIAKDLAQKNVNSLVFEIRFPPSFPHSPPFFRILKPRFLPFIQGGGGHVTGGGSICMDLLTTDGWLPSYSIPAVLLQIKMAISNPDPKPARLAQNWDMPYSMREAVEGFKRAASHHGWRIPKELDRLVL